MALLNLALLGAFAYLVLAPVQKPAAPGATDDSPISSAPARSTPEKNGLASAASLSANPESASAANAVGGEATSRLQSAIGTSSGQAPEFRHAATAQIDHAAEASREAASAEPANSLRNAVAAGGNVALQPQIPLAFSISPQGATSRQAAALGQLQQAFASQMNAGNPDPNSPEYQARWQTAQPMNDQSFKQKFGWQAFVQAQLAPDHGGEN